MYAVPLLAFATILGLLYWGLAFFFSARVALTAFLVVGALGILALFFGIDWARFMVR